MRVLVLNSGSSSIKFELYRMPDERVEVKGLLQRIGEPESELGYRVGERTFTVRQKVADHAEGLTLILSELVAPDRGGLADITEIGAVGHRVVHGGESFSHTTLVTDEVIAALEEHSQLAPLHNPPNLLGIRVAKRVLPDVPQVAVFDTAYHQTMPKQAYLYALPYELYERWGVRRYGFHGTSHRYVAERAAAMLGRPLEDTNVITCHLGNGASMTAVRGGRSVDTTMGLTPLEGLVMGTRAGDMDPAIIPYLERVAGMGMAEQDAMLNKKSGLLGISGISNDVRALLDAEAAGDERAKLALDVYAYRIRKYVGAYTAVLGVVHAVVFTAGVGENSAVIRERVLEGLGPLGYELNGQRNAGARGREEDVATDGSRSRILVIPTREELVIARDTYELAVG